MRNIFMIIVAFICLGALVYGQIHWDTKLKNAVTQTSVTIKNEINEETVKSEQPIQDNLMTSIDYARKLDSPIRELLVNRIANDKEVKLVIIGSRGLSSNEYTVWHEIVGEKLEETYGETFTISIVELEGKRSNEVVENNLHINNITNTPDIILLEPFTINDNGFIAVPNRLANLETMIQDFKNLNENVIVLLQPSIPIHNARFYPGEEEALREYALAKGYIYLNHWENWPDYTDAEVLNYLNNERSNPNQSGHDAWAQYIIDYFVKKEE
ncbi:SGNH/GDSL hydrolase family protein [Bacillus alkalisoli]|uniref:SGNH/GDSL hydrolase family protein n=1 Tax=Bacillus alkalisoli TaxID=2011008 RepID=UPI0012FF3457|nr:SGNH/GDSL hydrolase family protein [Bacillus alkalisoli]